MNVGPLGRSRRVMVLSTTMTVAAWPLRASGGLSSDEHAMPHQLWTDQGPPPLSGLQAAVVHHTGGTND
jgi:hypothetical protein